MIATENPAGVKKNYMKVCIVYEGLTTNANNSIPDVVKLIREKYGCLITVVTDDYAYPFEVQQEPEPIHRDHRHTF
jgi:hypothetical protein